jgi:hypothetical protein
MNQEVMGEGEFWVEWTAPAKALRQESVRRGQGGKLKDLGREAHKVLEIKPRVGQFRRIVTIWNKLYSILMLTHKYMFYQNISVLLGISFIWYHVAEYSAFQKSQRDLVQNISTYASGSQ